MVKQRYPANREGFIDEDKLFQICVGRLKLNYESYLEFSPKEIVLLLEQSNEQQRDELEALNVVFKVAIASVLKGKDMKIFKDENDTQEAKTFDSAEEKQQELENIFSSFN